MERRRILVIAAAIVAALGIVLVLLYVRGADQRAQDKFETVKVLVAAQPISAGESVEDALSQGKFATQDIVFDAVLVGAQSDTSAISGQFATQDIFAGEQIISGKFSQTAQAEVIESLQLPDGQQAVSINLTDPQRVAGFINPGSEVAVYYSTPGDGGGLVRILMDRVTVIGVGSTTPISAPATDANGQPIATEALPRTLMTLALDQKLAQKLIFAQENGSVFFSLLNKKSEVSLTVPAATSATLFN